VAVDVEVPPQWLPLLADRCGDGTADLDGDIGAAVGATERAFRSTTTALLTPPMSTTTARMKTTATPRRSPIASP